MYFGAFASKYNYKVNATMTDVCLGTTALSDVRISTTITKDVHLHVDATSQSTQLETLVLAVTNERNNSAQD
jgi:hypothetical protein